MASHSIRLPWIALLCGESALLAGVVELLDELDSVSLMVYALEFEDRTTAQMLRDHSPFYPFETSHLLHFAAAYGCLRAVHTLSKGAKPVCKSSKEYYGENGELLWANTRTTTPKSTSSTESTMRLQTRAQLMLWVNTLRFCSYPEGVMYEAAKLGDLQVVQWLHSTTQYASSIAVEHAARSGHLAVAQWLAEHTSVNPASLPSDAGSRRLEVTVPFDESLGIFAWVASNADAQMRRWGKVYPARLVHRSCFAFRGQQKTVVVSVAGVGAKELSNRVDNPVVFAAETGNIELLDVLQRSKSLYNWSFIAKALVQAVKNGHLDAIQWLIEVCEDEIDYSVDELVRLAWDLNHVDILKWLDTKFEFEPVSVKQLREAVQKGRLAVVIWAYERQSSKLSVKPEDLLSPHIKSRPANVVTWLHEIMGFCLGALMLPQFVRFGDVALVEMFLASIPPDQVALSTAVFESACQGGSIDMVRYLAEVHGLWSERGAYVAMQHSHWDVAEWIFETGRPCSKLECSAMVTSLRCGKAELVDRFLARGVQTLYPIHRLGGVLSGYYLKTKEPENYPHFLWGDRDDDYEWMKPMVALNLTYTEGFSDRRWLGAWAARYGHTDILWRLIDLEYPGIFTTANFERILKNTRDGRLVQAVLERRPELLSLRVVRWAAKYNQRSLLQFVLSREKESGRKRFAHCVQLAVTTATRHGDLDLLKWLHKQESLSRGVGIPFLHDPWTSAICGHVHILQWLYDSAFMDTSKLTMAMQACAKLGQLDSLKWWWDRGTGREYRFSLRDLRRAVGQQHVDVVEWILRKQPELRFEDPDLSHKVDSLLKKWHALCRKRE